MKIAGEIIGVFAIMFNFLIYQQKKRKSVLKVKLLSDISWALHYGLLTAFSGMAVCIVGTARETTFLLTDDKKEKRKYFLLAFAFLKKTKTELPYDPAIPLLGIYPEKTMIQKDTLT